MNDHQRIPNADGTAYPWFGIVTPRQIMGARDPHPIAHCITGVWLDRESAQAHLDDKRYRYGPHARVFTFSGHASHQWRRLCEEDPK